MIDIVNKKCDFPDCNKIPSYGYEGDKKATKCVTHKLLDMINIVDKKCIHEKIKSKCSDCRRFLPIGEVIERYKNSCLVCGIRLGSLNRKLERLCMEHSKEFDKRPEIYWREMVIQYMDFEPSSIDEVVGNCYKYRPDLTYVTDKVVYILELDEESHKDYEPECELKRLTLLKDSYPNHFMLVLRLNPHSCKSALSELKSLEERTDYMIDLLKKCIIYLEINKNTIQTHMIGIIYLFYNAGGVKHIQYSYNNPNSVNVLKTFYCDT